MGALLSKYSFEGEHWIELSDALGINRDDEEYDFDSFQEHVDAIREKTIDMLWDNFYENSQVLDDEYRQTIHNFLDKLIEQDREWGFSSTVFEAIRNLNSDVTLLHWMETSMEMMTV